MTGQNDYEYADTRIGATVNFSLCVSVCVCVSCVHTCPTLQVRTVPSSCDRTLLSLTMARISDNAHGLTEGDAGLKNDTLRCACVRVRVRVCVCVCVICQAFQRGSVRLASCGAQYSILG